MIEMRPSGGGRVRLVFYAPTRGLIGYQGELLTDTRGTAIMNRLFHAYAPFKGEIAGRRNGVLISNEQGEAVAYAMWKLEDRGPMMIEPGWKVYRGMIVGEHTRDNDLEINVLKGKQLTNIRTTVEGRGGAADAADPHDAGKGAGLYRGRRAGRGDAEVDPAAQEAARSERPQARRAAARKPSRSDARAGCRDASPRSRLAVAIASARVESAGDRDRAAGLVHDRITALAAEFSRREPHGNFVDERCTAATPRQTRSVCAFSRSATRFDADACQ